MIVRNFRTILAHGASAAALAVVFLGGQALADTTVPTEPQAVVGTFDQNLLQVMQNARTLGFKGRYAALQPVIDRTFDVPLMTRIAVGGGWATLNEEQQQTLTKAFGEFITATYAERFDGYSGETFTTTGSRPLGSGVLVETHLVKSDGQPITLAYVTRQNGERWQVVDVFLTGTISEMATRRSEFSAVFQRAGYDGLLQTLQAKVAQISNEA